VERLMTARERGKDDDSWMLLETISNQGSDAPRRPPWRGSAHQPQGIVYFQWLRSASGKLHPPPTAHHPPLNQAKANFEAKWKEPRTKNIRFTAAGH
jgi:hypothetical protein